MVLWALWCRLGVPSFPHSLCGTPGSIAMLDLRVAVGIASNCSIAGQKFQPSPNGSTDGCRRRLGYLGVLLPSA
jgi:hypothetical protein